MPTRFKVVLYHKDCPAGAEDRPLSELILSRSSDDNHEVYACTRCPLEILLALYVQSEVTVQ